MSAKPVLKLAEERGVHKDFIVCCGNCKEYICELWKVMEDDGEITWGVYDFGEPDEHYKYCPCCGCKLDWSILQEA